MTVSLCVAQPSLLIECHYLASKLRIIVCRAVRRGLNRTPAPLQCSLALFLILFLSARQPRSLARYPLCCSRLANTTRSVVVRSHFIDSPPRLLEVESVAGTSWYSPRYFAAGYLTLLIDGKSPIYILLLNIFSPRVTRVTHP